MEKQEQITVDLTSIVPDNWYDVEPIFADMTNVSTSAQHVMLNFVQAIPPSPAQPRGAFKTRVVARIVITPQHLRELAGLFATILQNAYGALLGSDDTACNQSSGQVS